MEQLITLPWPYDKKYDFNNKVTLYYIKYQKTRKLNDNTYD